MSESCENIVVGDRQSQVGITVGLLGFHEIPSDDGKVHVIAAVGGRWGRFALTVVGDEGNAARTATL